MVTDSERKKLKQLEKQLRAIADAMGASRGSRVFAFDLETLPMDTETGVADQLTELGAIVFDPVASDSEKIKMINQKFRLDAKHQNFESNLIDVLYKASKQAGANNSPLKDIKFETAESITNDKGKIKKAIQVLGIKMTPSELKTLLAETPFAGKVTELMSKKQPDGSRLLIDLNRLNHTKTSDLKRRKLDQSTTTALNILDKNNLLIGYNINFDATTLANIQQHGVRTRMDSVLRKPDYLDVQTVVFDALLQHIDEPNCPLKYIGKGSNKYYAGYNLAQAAEYYGVCASKDQTHHGVDDIELTVKVLQAATKDLGISIQDLKKYKNKFISPFHNGKKIVIPKGVKIDPTGVGAKALGRLSTIRTTSNTTIGKTYFEQQQKIREAREAATKSKQNSGSAMVKKQLSALKNMRKSLNSSRYKILGLEHSSHHYDIRDAKTGKPIANSINYDKKIVSVTTYAKEKLGDSYKRGALLSIVQSLTKDDRQRGLTEAVGKERNLQRGGTNYASEMGTIIHEIIGTIEDCISRGYTTADKVYGDYFNTDGTYNPRGKLNLSAISNAAMRAKIQKAMTFTVDEDGNPLTTAFTKKDIQDNLSRIGGYAYMRKNTLEIGDRVGGISEAYVASDLPDGRVLVGSIDLLYINKKGQWCIVDFKNTIHRGTPEYAFQIRQYAEMVKKITGQRVDSNNLKILHLSQIKDGKVHAHGHDIPLEQYVRMGEPVEYSDEHLARTGRAKNLAKKRFYNENEELIDYYAYQGLGAETFISTGAKLLKRHDVLKQRREYLKEKGIDVEKYLKLLEDEIDYRRKIFLPSQDNDDFGFINGTAKKIFLNKILTKMRKVPKTLEKYGYTKLNVIANTSDSQLKQLAKGDQIKYRNFEALRTNARNYLSAREEASYAMNFLTSGERDNPYETLPAKKMMQRLNQISEEQLTSEFGVLDIDQISDDAYAKRKTQEEEIESSNLTALEKQQVLKQLQVQNNNSDLNRIMHKVFLSNKVAVQGIKSSLPFLLPSNKDYNPDLARLIRQQTTDELKSLFIDKETLEEYSENTGMSRQDASSQLIDGFVDYLLTSADGIGIKTDNGQTLNIPNEERQGIKDFINRGMGNSFRTPEQVGHLLAQYLAYSSEIDAQTKMMGRHFPGLKDEEIRSLFLTSDQLHKYDNSIEFSQMFTKLYHSNMTDGERKNFAELMMGVFSDSVVSIGDITYDPEQLQASLQELYSFGDNGKITEKMEIEKVSDAGAGGYDNDTATSSEYRDAKGLFNFFYSLAKNFRGDQQGDISLQLAYKQFQSGAKNALLATHREIEIYDLNGGSIILPSYFFGGTTHMGLSPKMTFQQIAESLQSAFSGGLSGVELANDKSLLTRVSTSINARVMYLFSSIVNSKTLTNEQIVTGVHKLVEKFKSTGIIIDPNKNFAVVKIGDYQLVSPAKGKNNQYLYANGKQDHQDLLKLINQAYKQDVAQPNNAQGVVDEMGQLHEMTAEEIKKNRENMLEAEKLLFGSESIQFLTGGASEEKIEQKYQEGGDSDMAKKKGLTDASLLADVKKAYASMKQYYEQAQDFLKIQGADSKNYKETMADYESQRGIYNAAYATANDFINPQANPASNSALKLKYYQREADLFLASTNGTPIKEDESKKLKEYNTLYEKRLALEKESFQLKDKQAKELKRNNGVATPLSDNYGQLILAHQADIAQLNGQIAGYGTEGVFGNAHTINEAKSSVLQEEQELLKIKQEQAETEKEIIDLNSQEKTLTKDITNLELKKNEALRLGQTELAQAYQSKIDSRKKDLHNNRADFGKAKKRYKKNGGNEQFIKDHPGMPGGAGGDGEENSDDLLERVKRYQALMKQAASIETKQKALRDQANASMDSRNKQNMATQIKLLEMDKNDLLGEANGLGLNNSQKQGVNTRIWQNYQLQEAANGSRGQNSILGRFVSSAKNQIIHWSSMTLVNKAINSLGQSLQKITNYAAKLDTAIMNLRVATGEDLVTTTKLLGTYSELGKKLGATTEEVANAANTWLRQGYSITEANSLIDSTLKLSKLGMIESGQASQYLTSMIKGFKLEASDAISVVDKLTKVDMKYAASAGGIAEALSKTSVSAQMAGVNMDNLIGYVTEIIQTSQADEGSVGNAMKTMFARFGNVKAGKYTTMNTGDDGDDTTSGINDIERVLNKIGISVRSTSLEFRDFDDVLADIADKWQTMDSVSQNAIATALGGARQREYVSILLNNYQEAMDIAQDSASSAGTADDKYLAYTDSLESAIKKLQAAWEDLTMSFETNKVMITLANICTYLIDNLPTAIRYVTALFTAMNTFKMPTIFKNLWAYSGIKGNGDLLGHGFKGFFKGLGSRLTYKHTKTEFNAKQNPYGDTSFDSVSGDLTGNAKSHTIVGAVNNLTQAVNRNSAVVESNTRAETTKRPMSAADTEKWKNYAQSTNFQLKFNKDGSINKKSLAQLQAQYNQQNQGSVTKSKGQSGLSQTFGLSTKEMVATGIVTGITSGALKATQTEGNFGEKAVAGGMQALGAGVGTIFGPLGTIVGSAIGDVAGNLIVGAMQEEAKKREANLKEAAEIIANEKQTTANANTLEGLAKKTSLTANDQSQMKTLTKEMYDTSLYKYEARAKLATLLGKDVSDINFDYVYQTMTNGTQQERLNLISAIKASSAENNIAAQKTNLKYATIDFNNPKRAGEVTDLGRGFGNAYSKTIQGAEGAIFEKEARQYFTSKNGYPNIKGNTAAERLDNAQKFSDFLRQKMSSTTDQGAVLRYQTMLNENEKVVDYYSKIVGDYDAKRQEYDESILTSSATDYSYGKTAKELRSQGLNGLVSGIATKMVENGAEQGDIFNEDGSVKDSWTSKIKTYLKEVPGLESLFDTTSNSLLTLLSRKNNASNPVVAEEATKQINDIAQALGIESEELEKNADTWGLVTKAMTLMSTTELSSAQKKLREFIGEAESGKGLSAESIQAITSNYPQLLAYLGDEQEFLAQALKLEKEYNNLYVKSSLKDLVGSKDVYQAMLAAMRASGDNNISTKANEWFNDDEVGSVQDLIAQGKLSSDPNDPIAQFVRSYFANKQLSSSDRAEQLDRYRKVIDYDMQQQIDNLTKQKQAMTDINKQREYEIKLIEAKQKLENAQKEKKRVWREGVGWVYESDQNAVREATKAVEELQNQKTVSEIDKQITELQADKELLSKMADSEEIDNLRIEFKDFAGELTSTASLIQVLIDNWKNGITYGDILGNKNMNSVFVAETALASYASGGITRGGTETIITPQGTIAALPSGTGVVPADITKNIYKLDLMAPSIAKTLSPSQVGNKYSTDESLNVEQMVVNIDADSGFDVDKFVEGLKVQARLSKNNHR